MPSSRNSLAAALEEMDSLDRSEDGESAYACKNSRHDVCRSPVWSRPGGDRTTGVPDQPASHPTSDQGDPEIPILELCLPGFVETAYRQPVIAMKDRRDTERIEVTQQSGMKAGGTMQPMLLSHHLDPAVRQADARVSSSKTRHFSNRWTPASHPHPGSRYNALARATPAFRAADGPRLGWRRSVMPGSWRASRRSRSKGHQNHRRPE